MHSIVLPKGLICDQYNYIKQECEKLVDEIAEKQEHFSVMDWISYQILFFNLVELFERNIEAIRDISVQYGQNNDKTIKRNKKELFQIQKYICQKLRKYDNFSSI